MKRKIVLASAILVISALTAFFLLRRDSNSARFIPASANFNVPPYADVQYPFVLSSPFENGLVWLNTWDNPPGSAKTYLYDLEKRKVLGEIVNGWPVLGNRDQSKVLLMAKSTSLREDLFRFFDKLTRGKLNLASRNVEESFAIFDRERNQSKYVGRLYQYQGTSSRWYPSPDYRFAYHVTIGEPRRNHHLRFSRNDFEEEIPRWLHNRLVGQHTDSLQIGAT